MCELQKRSNWRSHNRLPSSQIFMELEGINIFRVIVDLVRQQTHIHVLGIGTDQIRRLMLEKMHVPHRRQLLHEWSIISKVSLGAPQVPMTIQGAVMPTCREAANPVGFLYCQHSLCADEGYASYPLVRHEARQRKHTPHRRTHRACGD
jgi:hypothetical protein